MPGLEGQPKEPNNEYAHLLDPSSTGLDPIPGQKQPGEQAAVRPEVPEPTVGEDVARRMGVAAAVRAAEDENGLPHTRDLR